MNVHVDAGRRAHPEGVWACFRRVAAPETPHRGAPGLPRDPGKLRNPHLSAGARALLCAITGFVPAGWSDGRSDAAEGETGAVAPQEAPWADERGLQAW